MIGIIGAMDVEVSLLLERLEETSARQISGLVFHEGRLCKQHVIVVRGGVGKVNAALCAEAMILCYHPDLIVNVGVAGALTGGFSLGDIAVAGDFVQYDVDTSALGDPVGFVSTVNRVDFPAAPWAAERMLDSLRAAGMPARIARFASGDKFNEDAMDKALIVRRFGAQVCEMEGCPIAQVCCVNGVDCAALRAISDATDGDHSAEYLLSRDDAAERAARALLAFLEDLPPAKV